MYKIKKRNRLNHFPQGPSYTLASLTLKPTSVTLLRFGACEQRDKAAQPVRWDDCNTISFLFFIW